MGCFLACFGSSKNRKNRKQRHKVQPRSQRNASYGVQSTVSLEQSSLETPIKSVKEIRDDDKPEEQPGSGLGSGRDDDKPEEQPGSGLGSGTRKKVTFNANVKTYEHVLVDESTDFELHNEKEGEKKERVKDENLAKPRESETSSGSSSSSYPPNHRYQNCRESDDEEEDELDYEESDLSDEEDDIEEDVGSNDGPFESDEPIGSIRGGSVLKPVENLAQWRAVKSKGSTPLKPQKENLSLEQEEPPRLSSSLDRSSFKEHSFSFSEEVSVDASLSNWLSSRETTPVKKSSTTFNACTPERNVSPRSISTRMSPEDRPILGALTLEEINKYSPSSLPRKSPSRSPDDIPIIGTVGTYWSHESTTTNKNSNSTASFKGIPNTTSKYREDKKVNWHSTPFEKRLEQALSNRGYEA